MLNTTEDLTQKLTGYLFIDTDTISPTDDGGNDGASTPSDNAPGSTDYTGDGEGDEGNTTNDPPGDPNNN